MGSGAASSCGKWLAYRNSGRELPMLSMLNWALGYISGAATWADDIGDPLRGTDLDGVAYWFDNYCAAQPDNPFSDAVKAFMRNRLR